MGAWLWIPERGIANPRHARHTLLRRGSESESHRRAVAAMHGTEAAQPRRPRPSIRRRVPRAGGNTPPRPHSFVNRHAWHDVPLRPGTVCGTFESDGVVRTTAISEERGAPGSRTPCDEGFGSRDGPQKCGRGSRGTVHRRGPRALRAHSRPCCGAVSRGGPESGGSQRASPCRRNQWGYGIDFHGP